MKRLQCILADPQIRIQLILLGHATSWTDAYIIQFLLFQSLRRVTDSVTRFGEISPVCRNFKSLGYFWYGLFSIWQTFVQTFAFFCHWPNFQCCKWSQIEEWNSYLVTLVTDNNCKESLNQSDQMARLGIFLNLAIYNIENLSIFSQRRLNFLSRTK